MKGFDVVVVVVVGGESWDGMVSFFVLRVRGGNRGYVSALSSHVRILRDQCE